MQTLTQQDGAQPFDVSVRECAGSSIVVIFAVGAGGNPERHHTLLDTETTVPHVSLACQQEPSSQEATGPRIARQVKSACRRWKTE